MTQYQINQLYNRLRWMEENNNALAEDLAHLRKTTQHLNNELSVATAIIHELRTQHEKDTETIDELRRTTRRVKAVTPNRLRTPAAGAVETVRFVDLSPLTYEQIMQRMYAEAATVEAESEEQLSQITALFDRPDQEFTQLLGRRPNPKRFKLMRPGAWSANALEAQQLEA